MFVVFILFDLWHKAVCILPFHCNCELEIELKGGDMFFVNQEI